MMMIFNKSLQRLLMFAFLPSALFGEYYGTEATTIRARSVDNDHHGDNTIIQKVFGSTTSSMLINTIREHNNLVVTDHSKDIRMMKHRRDLITLPKGCKQIGTQSIECTLDLPLPDRTLKTNTTVSTTIICPIGSISASVGDPNARADFSKCTSCTSKAITFDKKIVPCSCGFCPLDTDAAITWNCRGQGVFFSPTGNPNGCSSFDCDFYCNGTGTTASNPITKPTTVMAPNPVATPKTTPKPVATVPTKPVVPKPPIAPIIKTPTIPRSPTTVKPSN